jgi:hypothetical protein
MVEDNLIKITVEKEIKSLFKYYLEILEEQKLPESQHNLIRKKVLDSSNNTLRDVLQFLSYFDFTINAQRVENAARTKEIIYSKTIYSPPVIID